jgi:hydrogenase nickel incorporation protein HypA/HybF
MHELALMESVVEAVIEQLGDQRVALVRLEIGALAGVAVDAMRFSFDICSRGTSLEGATLDVVEVPARGRCRACGSEHVMRRFGTSCTCGSFDLELIAGGELRLKEVEVH